MKAFVGAACLATIVASGCQTSDVLSNFSPSTSASSQLADYDRGEGHATSEPAPAGLPTPSRKSTTSGSSPAASVPVAQKLRAGDDAIRAGQLSTARSMYEEVLATQPDNPAAHHGLAIIADREQRFSDAEKHYLAALKGDPHNADLIANLGYSYLLQGRYSESETHLRTALTKNPEHRSAIGNLGVVYARMGDQERARQMFARILPPEEVDQKLAELTPEKSGKRDSLLARLTGDNEPQDDPTQELLRRMEEARQRDQTQRQPEPPTQPRQMPIIAANNAPNTGRVPDSELNRVFSEIDRQGAPQNSEPIVLGPRAGNAQTPMAQGQTLSPAHAVGNQPSAPGSNGSWPGQPATPQDQAPAVAQNGFGLNGFPNTLPEAEANAAASPWPPASPGTPPATPTDPALGSNAGVMPAGGTSPQGFGQPQGAGGVNRATWQSGVPSPAAQASHGQPAGGSPAVGSTGSGRPDGFEQAKREAAALGLGAGPGLLFPMMPQTTPRVSPGTASVWNGGQYPAPERHLPTMPQQPAGAVPASYAAPQSRVDVEAYRRGAPSGGGFGGQAEPTGMTGQSYPRQGSPTSAISPGLPPETPTARRDQDSLQPYDQQRQAIDAGYNSMVEQNLGGAHAAASGIPTGNIGSATPMPAPTFEWERPENYSATPPRYGQPSQSLQPQGSMAPGIPAGAIPLQAPPAQNGTEQGYGQSPSASRTGGLVTPAPYTPMGTSESPSGGHTMGIDPHSQSTTPYEGPVIIPGPRR
ncbi:MAG: tetratricopeptide repeat protein [Maioricimonas sp. JB045]